MTRALGYAGVINVEALRRTVMGMGHCGYVVGGIKMEVMRKTVVGMEHWGYAGGP